MSATLQDVANKRFDYVIIGGGTAGLTLAARLAEDPDLSIAVLEAGSAHFNDPLIKVPAQFGKQFGNPEYDWFFMTTPQSHSNGGVYLWPRGKMLGGSSAVNFMAWNKPPSQDIDAWEKLGNPGWNWERFSEYTKRVEKFIPPKKDIAEKNKQLFKAEGHGYDGPLITSFPELIAAAEVPIQETLMKAGIPIAKDPLNGDPIGSSMAINTLDPTDCTRTDAMTAYYLPNKDKPNLKVLCNALVHRIISEKDGAEVKAIGVLFEHSGALHTVLIGKEVILCAGALKSPQILELSGIGSSELLQSLGIQPILNLPGVGTNAQEHISCMVTFELDSKHGIETLDALEDPEYAAKHLALHAEGEGLYRMGLSGFSVVPLSSLSTPKFAKELIVKQRSRIEEKIKSGSLAPGLKEQYEIQLEELEKQRGGDVELTCFPKWFFGAIEKGKGYIMVVSVLNHPFSRGTVHIKSSDPNVQPDMDPHYFEEEFDLDLIATSLKFVRKMPEIEPFKSLVAKEVAPGPSVTTDGQLKDYIKKSLNTTFHTLGTLSMLPREHNGVVDPRLLVYGTKNIRVADLSIVPLQLAAHTQAVAFAIGEVAADILKGTI